ncbi:MAG: hypothetical protein KKD59_02675, partial [Acidobacteria bacterium]|nr:hypothetical protein [Acidobacteriota bacterium]
PELNASPHILVMTDEAHRSQYKQLGANFDKGLPNAARIGYTGTPIDKSERRSSLSFLMLSATLTVNPMLWLVSDSWSSSSSATKMGTGIFFSKLFFILSTST